MFKNILINFSFSISCRIFTENTPCSCIFCLLITGVAQSNWKTGVEEKHLGHLTHAKAHIAVSGIRPRTEVIKPAQAKSKAYKILGVSESQINGLAAFSSFSSLHTIT